MLSASLKENDLHLSDSQLDKMVTDTFHTYDTNKDGYVNQLDLAAAYCSFLSYHPLTLQRAGLCGVPKHVRPATQRAQAIHLERHGHHQAGPRRGARSVRRRQVNMWPCA